MEKFRIASMYIAFLWFGVLFTQEALEQTAKPDWNADAMKVGLNGTIVIVLLTLAEVLIRRGIEKARRSRQSNSAQTTD